MTKDGPRPRRTKDQHRQNPKPRRRLQERHDDDVRPLVQDRVAACCVRRPRRRRSRPARPVGADGPSSGPSGSGQSKFCAYCEGGPHSDRGRARTGCTPTYHWPLMFRTIHSGTAGFHRVMNATSGQLPGPSRLVKSMTPPGPRSSRVILAVAGQLAMSDGELRIAACPRLIVVVGRRRRRRRRRRCRCWRWRRRRGAGKLALLRRSVSVPWTGPRHVVPVYGTVRVSIDDRARATQRETARRNSRKARRATCRDRNRRAVELTGSGSGDADIAGADSREISVIEVAV
jgi:hypothetical protein